MHVGRKMKNEDSAGQSEDGRPSVHVHIATVHVYVAQLSLFRANTLPLLQRKTKTKMDPASVLFSLSGNTRNHIPRSHRLLTYHVY